jgi:hypothetical protein
MQANKPSWCPRNPRSHTARISACVWRWDVWLLVLADIAVPTRYNQALSARAPSTWLLLTYTKKAPGSRIWEGMHFRCIYQRLAQVTSVKPDGRREAQACERVSSKQRLDISAAGRGASRTTMASVTRMVTPRWTASSVAPSCDGALLHGRAGKRYGIEGKQGAAAAWVCMRAV